MNIFRLFCNPLTGRAIACRPSRPVQSATAHRPSVPVRNGITLVEMLVALAVTLLMMGAVITVFGMIGERVTDSRGIIETNDRLRSAAHRLREDLTSITVDPIPWQRPEAGAGYLEILEGPIRDYAADSTGTVSVIPGGDIDDLLTFTVRSEGDPYRGKFGDSFIESNTAEVVWYMRPTLDVATNPPTYKLCRRQMLVVPAVPADATIDGNFFNLYDVSARIDRLPNGSPARVANTLGDLTKRENRFMHNKRYVNNESYPWLTRYVVERTGNTEVYMPPVPPLSELRRGEEVVLANVLSFDVQVYDPNVSVRQVNGVPVLPHQPGYASKGASAFTPDLRGGYVDLNNKMSTVPPGTPAWESLSMRPHPKSGFPATNVGVYSVYDTWSFHYEHDGLSQPTASIPGVVDAGTNGLDDNPMQFPGVDDMSERETSPPYPIPLRGLRVKIRVYEPGSKQVREMTVVQSFVPE